MVRASDLMIGDWVRVTDDDTDESFVGRVSEFEQVDKRYYNVHVSDDEDSFGYPFDEDCIEPIPLTPEILEKNLDKKINYGIFDDYFDFEIREFSDGMFIVNYHYCEMSLPGTQIVGICYVHELQHALRICGIEKEIVL